MSNGALCVSKGGRGTMWDPNGLNPNRTGKFGLYFSFTCGGGRAGGRASSGDDARDAHISGGV